MNAVEARAALGPVFGEAVDALIAEALAERAPENSPRWLYGSRSAAEYLGWPLGRVEKLTAAGALPCHRVGRRVSYLSSELDGWLLEHDGDR